MSRLLCKEANVGGCIVLKGNNNFLALSAARNEILAFYDGHGGRHGRNRMKVLGRRAGASPSSIVVFLRLLQLFVIPLLPIDWLSRSIYFPWVTISNRKNATRQKPVVLTEMPVPSGMAPLTMYNSLTNR